MPERLEISAYIVYKRRYINIVPFLSFPFLVGWGGAGTPPTQTLSLRRLDPRVPSALATRRLYFRFSTRAV